MPISWKGTLQQYAGRLHRLWESKREVRIYDYIDIRIPVLERMYHRRLNGYNSIGYKIKPMSDAVDQADIIYDKNSFYPVYTNDLMNANLEIVIVSPFVSSRRTMSMLEYFQKAIGAGVQVKIITRPIVAYRLEDQQKVSSLHKLIEESGVALHLKDRIHQKFAIIDQKIVWYGSINLLSFGNAEESIMRLKSKMIAGELGKGFEGL